MSGRSPFSPDLQRHLLANSPLQTVEVHGLLDSTNARAREVAGMPTPALIVTKLQTAGRGRADKVWWADDGALTFSLVIGANEMTCDVPWLSLGTAVAVCRSLEMTYPQGRFELKWPNDVWLDGQKVSGVLIERVAGLAPQVIVGVGVNVNNSIRHAPAEVRQRAVALCDRASREFDLTHMLTTLINQILRQLRATDESVAAMQNFWSSRCALTGKVVRVRVGPTCVCGKCHGIDPEGRLRVEVDGTLQRLVSGTVSIEYPASSAER